MPAKTIITYSPKYAQYDLGEGHPFRGDRFTNAMNYFKTQGLLSHPEISLVEPTPATEKELLKVHTPEYIQEIFALAQQNKAYDPETPISQTILEAALLITGAAIHCGKTIQQNKAKKAVSLGGGFHHAGKSYGGGFCLFNDIAVLIEYLRTEHSLKRFLILDHDVHFGNGTSDIYYRDPTVLYISLHQDPRTIYPGTGFIDQIGEAQGEGYNVNVPLPPGTGDETYLYALNEIFPSLAEEFKPEIIITNGGSDPHFADMLGDLNLTTKGFYQIATIARQTAEKTSDKKLILIPGSGYNPRVLPQCWHALIAGAVGLPEPDVSERFLLAKEPSRNRGIVERTLDELKRLLRKHWACFGGFGINVVP